MVTVRKCSKCGHEYSVAGSSYQKTVKGCAKCTRRFDLEEGLKIAMDFLSKYSNKRLK